MKSTENKYYDFLEYADELSEEELAYVEKFYKEYYFADFYNEENIIKDPDAKKDAIRNHNSRTRDAFTKSAHTNQLKYDPDNKEGFMQDASDEWEWRDAYKVGGFELATDVIMNSTLRDLDNEFIDRKTTLARYFIKMDALRKQHTNIERKNRKGKKK